MNRGLAKAIVLLPVPVLIIVPAIILILSRGTIVSPDVQVPTQVTFWVAVDFLTAGIFLAAWSARVIVAVGEGTPAPWEPTRKLVIAGPYRYVRNPIITGVLLILIGETILWNTWALFLWAVVFFVANLIYFPVVEENGLEQRFGEEYLAYKAHVPRWIPRLQSWDGKRTTP
ncbi:hypothetical protein D3OALGA1CA_2238 [Olavius algarvensis associated proteobacterium Delta 3]|nr:hypothetical protein D3OALGA1CA_2238 [Olavius algarvensis associated proteobacterium Delta 3]